VHHDTRALRLACPSGLLTTIRKALEKAGVEFTNGNKPGAATPHEGLLWQVPVGEFEAPGRCAQNAPAARREAADPSRRPHFPPSSSGSLAMLLAMQRANGRERPFLSSVESFNID